MRMILATVAAICLSGFTLGEDKKPLVKANLVKLDGDSIVYTITVTKEVVVNEVVVMEKDGKKIEVLVPVKKTVAEQQEFKMAIATLDAVDMEGKAITADDLKEKLKTPQPIVFTPQPATPEMRKQYEPGTLFVHNKKK